MKAPPFRNLSGKYLYIYKYCALVKRHEWQYRLSLCVVLYIVQFKYSTIFWANSALLERSCFSPGEMGRNNQNFDIRGLLWRNEDECGVFSLLKRSKLV